jgi:hypothetical protein
MTGRAVDFRSRLIQPWVDQGKTALNLKLNSKGEFSDSSRHFAENSAPAK